MKEFKKREPQGEVSIYQSIKVPTSPMVISGIFQFGIIKYCTSICIYISIDEFWVVTVRMRSLIQAAEISFFRRVTRPSLRDRVRSSYIRKELGVKPLLPRVQWGPVEVVQASYEDASWAPSFASTPNWEETPKYTQNMLEGTTYPIWLGNASGTHRSWKV